MLANKSAPPKKAPEKGPLKNISRRGLFLGGLYSEGLIYGGKFAFQSRLS